MITRYIMYVCMYVCMYVYVYTIYVYILDLIKCIVFLKMDIHPPYSLQALLCKTPLPFSFHFKQYP
jgi:hypothetical protein